jgi:hypothetical protein
MHRILMPVIYEMSEIEGCGSRCRRDRRLGELMESFQSKWMAYVKPKGPVMYYESKR